MQFGTSPMIGRATNAKFTGNPNMMTITLSLLNTPNARPIRLVRFLI